MILFTGWGCYPSMHCRWYPSIPCSRSPERGGSAPGGFCSWGGGCLVETPPRDGYCCGRYASYWNAFLFFSVCTQTPWRQRDIYSIILIYLFTSTLNISKIIFNRLLFNQTNFNSFCSTVFDPALIYICNLTAPSTVLNPGVCLTKVKKKQKKER